MLDALLVKNVPEPVTAAVLPKNGMLVGHGENIDSAGGFWSRERRKGTKSRFRKALSTENHNTDAVFSVICVTRDVLADCELMHAIQRSQNDDVFKTIFVKAMVSYHWEAYGRFYFYLDLVAYMVCIAVMVRFALGVQTRLDTGNDAFHTDIDASECSDFELCYSADAYAHVLAGVVLTFTIYFLWSTVAHWCRVVDAKRHLYGERQKRGIAPAVHSRSFTAKTYRFCVALCEGTVECSSDPWYSLSLLTSLSVLVLVSLHFRSGKHVSGEMIDVLRHVNVVATLLVCLQLLSFLRGEDTLGPYISLLAKVLYDIIPFFAIVLVVLLSFGTALYLLVMNKHPHAESLTAFAMLNALLAMHETDDYMAGDVMGAVLMVLLVILAGVVINSLVVSILGDTYDRWRAVTVTERQVLRATLIVHARNKRETFAWLRRLFLRAAVSNGAEDVGDLMGDSDEGYMTVLLPLESESGLVLWKGRLNLLQRHVNSTNEKLDKKMEQLERKLDAKLDFLVQMVGGAGPSGGGACSSKDQSGSGSGSSSSGGSSSGMPFDGHGSKRASMAW